MDRKKQSLDGLEDDGRFCLLLQVISTACGDALA